jgi:hypothetical protein
MTLIDNIKSLPRKRDMPDVRMLGISKEILTPLRITSAQYDVPMGRIAELAIMRLMADITAEQSKPMP